jgi:hydrogenase-4 component B
MALTSFLLVVVGGSTPAAARAGFVYLVMTHLSAVVMLIGFLTLGAATGTTVFAQWVVAVPALGQGVRSAAFLMLLAGFATKAGLVPFHIWLPRAHPEAPGYVSALMSGVMVKVAMYALLRFAFTILGVPAPWWGALLVCLGLVSAILGGLAAQSSLDTKGVLAYSTIENMGILAVALGLALAAKAEGHPAFVALALAAFALHSVAHAVYKTLLFMGAGAVQQATGTRDLGRLGGLIRTLPITAGLVLVGAVAVSAVPGLAGFPGEWALLVCAGRLFTLDMPPYLRLLGYISLSGLALTAGLVLATFARLYGTAFLGLPRSAQAVIPPAERGGAERVLVSSWMRWPMGATALLCGVLGLAPGLTLRLFSAAAKVVAGAGAPGSGVPSLAWSGPIAHWWLLSVPLVAAVGLAALMGKARAERASLATETWNCGSPLEAQMQYSAGGFSQPFARSFRFRPFVERRLYQPVRDGFVLGASALRRLQSGSVNAYMAYVLVTLLVLIAAASRMH